MLLCELVCMAACCKKRIKEVTELFSSVNFSLLLCTGPGVTSPPTHGSAYLTEHLSEMVRR